MKGADKKAREWTKKFAQAKLPPNEGASNAEDELDQQMKTFLQESEEVMKN